MALPGDISESSPRLEDDNLVGRVRSGDKQALALLFDRHYEGLCRFVHSLIGSRLDVDDLVQEIFVKIWINKDHWDPHGSIKSYLFKAAKNQALNYLKSRRAKKSSGSADELVEVTSGMDAVSELEDKELLAALSLAITRLPRKTKIVFKLSREEGMTYSEISEIMGISVKTVEHQIARALKILRKQLLEFWE
jgi:RNA polymerase sigma-70 factor (ECF subfamily)